MISSVLQVESALGQERQDVLSHAGQKQKREALESFHSKALKICRIPEVDVICDLPKPLKNCISLSHCL